MKTSKKRSLAERITSFGILLGAFIVIGVSLVVSCVPPQPGQKVEDYISRWHDDRNNVTCWIYDIGTGAGISCLPDVQLGPK